MKTWNKLAAPCGLYCGVCSVYVADTNNDIGLKEKIAPVYGVTVEELQCDGCNSDRLFKYCRTCSIRDCVTQKGFEGCYQCRDFPCKFTEAFPTEAGRKIMSQAISRWRELGTEKWVEEENKRYRCPQCGAGLLRGARRCRNCRNQVAID